MNSNDFLYSLGRALRHSLRALARRPAFTFAAVSTLALGLGATTAIFSVVYGVLMKPLPYPDADELVSVRHTAPGHPFGLGGGALGSAESMYVTYREENRTFEHVGLWADSERTLTGLGEPERVRTLSVTQGTLQALGVQPAFGRGFSDAEHASAAEGPDPVILSHAFWLRRFGSDESALGRTLSLDDRPSQVVGVMPADFRFLNLTRQPDVVSALRIDRGRLTLDNLNYNGLARLKHGVTLAEASADVARMVPIWLDAWPASATVRETVAGWRVAPALRPLKDDVVGSVGGMLWTLMGAVGAVLLIACANIANLLLARADARRQELAIRAVLGAGRRRIAGELLGESLVLGAMGGAVGLALAYAGLELLAALAPTNLPRVEDIAVGPPVLAFAVAAALISSLLFGSIPAVKHAVGSDALLRSGARDSSASRERNRTRSALIVLQVALALVLLVGAGLMIRTFGALTAIEPGFTDPDHVQFARIFIPPTVMREPERYNRAYRDILERIAALPGVTATGWGDVPLVGGRGSQAAISVEDRPDVAGESPPTRHIASVSPGYFGALGTRLVAGVDITWADVEAARKVALVSENLARELWGEPQAAIGKRIQQVRTRNDPGGWSEIIGVTQDVYQDGLYQRPPAIVYYAWMTDGNARAITYAIRSDDAGTERLNKQVRQAVWATHPDLAVFDVRTLREIYSGSLAQTSFMLVLLGIASAMALVLSLVGIYGVISYIVSQRSREIGIRLALGAQVAGVKRMFVLYALAVATIGIAAGLAAAVAFSRWMASLLFEVRPLDPATYVAVVGVLLSAVWLAAYLPARRAASIDPAETLRAD